MLDLSSNSLGSRLAELNVVGGGRGKPPGFRGSSCWVTRQALQGDGNPSPPQAKASRAMENAGPEPEGSRREVFAKTRNPLEVWRKILASHLLGRVFSVLYVYPICPQQRFPCAAINVRARELYTLHMRTSYSWSVPHHTPNEA